MSTDDLDPRAARAVDELRRIARTRGESVQRVLTRYGLERLLYRLGRSPERDGFVLKGALLLAAWDDVPDRATRDIDLLGYGDGDREALERVLHGACTMTIDEDAARFDPASVRITEIRHGDRYGGLRAKLAGTLGSVRLSVALDVGYGDAVTPDPEELRFPALLDEPEPRLLGYPAETVVAEKLEAIVSLGTRNTRMKDYHDLYEIARARAFDGPLLVRALVNTFDRRRTPLPDGVPAGLDADFANDDRSVRLWRAFISAADLRAPSLAEVCDALTRFLVAPSIAARRRQRFDEHWPAGGPWSTADGARRSRHG